MKKYKIYYFFGLPSSGKSTLARKILLSEDNFARVNKDDIRGMIRVWQKKNKQFPMDLLYKMLFHVLSKDEKVKQILNNIVSDIQKKLCKISKKKKFTENNVIQFETIVVQILSQYKKNIIIDNTGYNLKHLRRIKIICKDYKFEIIDMHRDYNITLEQCVERNKNRQAKVPDVAIYGMNKRYNVINTAKSQIKAFESDKDYIVVDLDGTLADCKHRLKYIDGTDGPKKNWKMFFEGMGDDPVIENIKDLIDLTYPNHDVVLATGRPEDYRGMTEAWLKKHNIRYNVLYMRPFGDYRPDTIVKQEMLDLYMEKEKIEMWIDDKPEVIEQVRTNKVKTLLVKG